jgi:hypothetical protein
LPRHVPGTRHRALVRSRDPFQTMNGSWLVRRLSPDSKKANWLRVAARDMAEATRRDWKRYRKPAR